MSSATDSRSGYNLNLMIPANVAIGSLIVVYCLMMLAIERRIMATTRKGQWLIRRFGTVSAPWVFRGLVIAWLVVGALLAVGVIRPIQW